MSLCLFATIKTYQKLQVTPLCLGKDDIEGVGNLYGIMWLFMNTADGGVNVLHPAVNELRFSFQKANIILYIITNKCNVFWPFLTI
jgi:hypothetical protein